MERYIKKDIERNKRISTKNVTGYKTGIGTAAKGVFNEMLGDILFSKNTLLDMGSTIINYFSSIGGIIAMLFDISDGLPDQHLTLKYRVFCY